jgi:hypothetical protein
LYQIAYLLTVISNGVPGDALPEHSAGVSGLTGAGSWQTLLSMIRVKVARVLVVCSLVVAIGGHWALLQSIAWIGMFAKFSQTCSLAEAWVKTFDGNHPCKLCIVVQEGKKSQQKQEPVPVQTKLDFFILNDKPFEPGPGFRLSGKIAIRSQFAHERFEQPPTPPPRVA